MISTFACILLHLGLSYMYLYTIQVAAPNWCSERFAILIWSIDLVTTNLSRYPKLSFLTYLPSLKSEITRLQYSIKRLRETQEALKGLIDEAVSPETADAEIVQAFKENQDVIGSQEERILILKLALADKGISTGSHYDVDTGTSKVVKAPPHDPNGEEHDDPGSIVEDDSGGFHL
ncbi:hypothetical protein GGU10DRAFT_49701 [Lentinula aff. detonsa]|uniref:Uncharacterized protein n=1 Tax=Lentinula aff. detonsa TaxID=2804958 RepID=A0AA38NR07_9AGAR|nr:hypothetical protein GGU10DRAFT_49701 [Lentinula aff. detonsa]